MSDADLEFKNILILNFGQLGDVILSLPALLAIRERFPKAKLTVMGGKAVSQIVTLSGFSDEQIIVDRVELRDSPRLWSIRQISKIVRDIRIQKFDLIIDLHSLSETNLLGFVSGAGKRLYGNRENRSLDILSNFRPKPPREDKSKHLTDKYLDIISSLGIKNPKRLVSIAPPWEEAEEAGQLFEKLGLTGKTLIGLFLGRDIRAGVGVLIIFPHCLRNWQKKKACEFWYFSDRKRKIWLLKHDKSFRRML